mmetsp:Transcript_23585/g.59633  ORF Transcript_23585/g.59633 Transcript_23585/m.59633 type:complete len:299 (-) Transcript_23585:230-1126(-)
MGRQNDVRDRCIIVLPYTTHHFNVVAAFCSLFCFCWSAYLLSLRVKEPGGVVSFVLFLRGVVLRHGGRFALHGGPGVQSFHFIRPHELSRVPSCDHQPLEVPRLLQFLHCELLFLFFSSELLLQSQNAGLQLDVVLGKLFVRVLDALAQLLLPHAIRNLRLATTEGNLHRFFLFFSFFFFQDHLLDFASLHLPQDPLLHLLHVECADALHDPAPTALPPLLRTRELLHVGALRQRPLLPFEGSLLLPHPFRVAEFGLLGLVMVEGGPQRVLLLLNVADAGGHATQLPRAVAKLPLEKH